MGTFISFVIAAFAGIFLIAAISNLVWVFFGGERSDEPQARREALLFAGLALALIILVVAWYVVRALLVKPLP